MHLSARGHEVACADNYLRRTLGANEGGEPLFPTPRLPERAAIWKAASGKDVRVFEGDLSQWDFVDEVFTAFTPDAVVHYAEQPSAPYSMMHRRAASLTLTNNLATTANCVFAVREFCPKAHIVKLGTMGEYGTPNIDIEEGWLEVEHKGRRHRFLYPRQASSLYHTTKIMDTDMLWFYVRTWGIAVTDLMQGPVYGMSTVESGDDERLMPFFNYDELFGTVLNRFMVQAVAGIPLTVYGSGRQIRGYLNLIDTVNCVRLALESPAKPGELRVFNQLTETFDVLTLADRVKRVGEAMGIDVRVQHLPNPRKEAEEHYYNPAYTGLTDLGLKPTLLTDGILRSMMEIVARHKASIRPQTIFRGVKWA